MWSWKTLCQSLLVISLLFFAIPIRVKGPETELRDLFNQYIKNFNKSYVPGTPEYEKRYEAFKYTLFRIEEYNKNKTHNDSATYGLTKFSDLTEQEFAAKHLSKIKHNHRRKLWKKMDRKHSHSNEVDSGERVRRALSNSIPRQVDWRKFNIISPVVNQGLCGACWAFSTVHTIEAMSAKKNHNLTRLSVQEAIDCSTNGNRGCAGGDICNLLLWITQNDVSLKSETEYPFHGETESCKIKENSTPTGVHVKDFTCQSMVNSELQILKWIAENGPVAVAVNALSWQNYLGGVIQFHCDGNVALLNHAVQIVGYDLDAQVPHYIAKNSWGTKYGNDGYVFLAIEKNMCGVANEVSMIAVL